jgi:hypothetical protein
VLSDKPKAAYALQEGLAGQFGEMSDYTIFFQNMVSEEIQRGGWESAAGRCVVCTMGMDAFDVLNGIMIFYFQSRHYQLLLMKGTVLNSTFDFSSRNSINRV